MVSQPACLYFIANIADQIAELLIGQPRHIHSLRDIVKVLEAQHVLFKLHAEVGDDIAFREMAVRQCVS